MTLTLRQVQTRPRSCQAERHFGNSPRDLPSPQPDDYRVRLVGSAASQQLETCPERRRGRGRAESSLREAPGALVERRNTGLPPHDLDV
jgi:hypothetical protein